MMRTWWKRIHSRRSSRPSSQVRSGRPRLESLEDRLVPAPVVRSGTGPTTAILQPIVDQFRNDLGANNGNGGTFLTGRREINWDGAGAPNVLPGDFFNTTVARGLVSVNPGGFRLSQFNPPAGQERFGDINPTYPASFTTFSSPRLFAATGSVTSDQTFFVPGTTIPASVSGFGAVFTDVDNVGRLEFFDQSNNSLGVFSAPVLNNGLSFLGVSFNAGERVARVRITAGTAALAAGVNDSGATDVVALDDFIYGEPQPVRFQFSAATYAASEGVPLAQVTVLRTGGSVGTASVTLSTLDATARNGFDYTVATQVLTFANGETSKTVQIPIHEDQLVEGLETLNLTLTANSAGTVLGTPSLAILTIVDNDTPPVALLGLTSNNKLVRFDAANPGTILNTVTITGLQAGENIRGIDYRPFNGQLYGLGTSSRLYTIDPATGAAVLVGPGSFTPALLGASFGLDFNPTVDRLRVVSDADQNLRLNPATGAVAGTDTNLAFAAGDPNQAANPNVVASAYTNNFNGAGITTLYGIDSNLDILIRQGGNGGVPSPNGGALGTLAPLGFDVQEGVGFDIAAIGNQAFAAMTLVGESVTRLFSLVLPAAAVATPVATPIGAIGGPDSIIGLAVVPPGAFQFQVDTQAVNEFCDVCLPLPGQPIVNTVTVTVTRTGGTEGVATVNYSVTAGSATPGTDFVAANGVLVFNSGETSKFFLVTINDDNLREGLETIQLTLSNPTGGTILGTRTRASITILDNETPQPFFYALTNMNKLLRISAAEAGRILSTTTITGLQAGENILGIDYRPANGQLYGLGSSSRLYTINPTTGAATQVGTGTFAVPLAGTEFGFDFNPAADRIRVVSNTGQNLRLIPDTGAVVDFDPGTPGVQPDTSLAFVLNDLNTGATPNIVGAAYTNNVAGAATTTLFNIDAARGELVRQGGVDGTPTPNDGQLTTVGSLGVQTQTLVGFDIAAGGTALAVFTGPNEMVSRLYEINLATGAATYLGDIASPELMRGLAIVPAGVVQFSTTTLAVAENVGTVTLLVRRTGGTEGAITASFATSDGTGRAGVDYVAATGTVTFAAGAREARFVVTILDNGRVDSSRNFNVNLTTVTSGATLGAATSVVITVNDNNDAALTQNQRFVTQIFLDLLNRAPDPGGLTTFTNLLTGGGTRDQVARAIATSTEYRTLVVRGLYQKYLRRDADPNGLNGFVGFLAAGGTVEGAIASMVGSAEYFNGPGGGTNNGFLTALFQDVLGRGIDPGALTAFGNLLASGTSRSQVANVILSSTEYLESVVKGAYVRLLGRAGDTAGINAYVAFLRGGGRQEDLFVIFGASAEYFGRV